MAHENRPSVRFRRIGSALRQAREERRLTLGTASRRFGRSSGWLSTVETGQIPIRVDDLADLLDLYDIDDGPLRDSLLYLAAQGRKRNWTRAYEGKISPAALDFASLETDSAAVSTFQANLIPGLLQIESYARTVIEAGLPSLTHDNEALVAFRMARQGVLYSKHPPRYTAIIGEAVLHNTVGNEEIMGAQLRHLAHVAHMEHITIHLLPIPASAFLWVAAPFNLFELRPPGELVVAAADQVTQSSFAEDEHEVRLYEEIFNHLMSACLDKHHSLLAIQRLISKP